MGVSSMAALADNMVGKSDGELDADVRLHQPTPSDVFAYDDVDGSAWDPRFVSQAGEKEIAYFKSMGVHRKAPIAKAMEMTRKGCLYP